MPQLIWLPEAVADLQRLHRFLADHSENAARRAATAIVDGADALLLNPTLGRPLGDGRREWFVPFGVGAYVLRYRVDPVGRLVVIRVWHSREERLPG